METTVNPNPAALSLKQLHEERATLVKQMAGITDAAKYTQGSINFCDAMIAKLSKENQAFIDSQIKAAAEVAK